MKLCVCRWWHKSLTGLFCFFFFWRKSLLANVIGMEVETSVCSFHHLSASRLWNIWEVDSRLQFRSLPIAELKMDFSCYPFYFPTIYLLFIYYFSMFFFFFCLHIFYKFFYFSSLFFIFWFPFRYLPVRFVSWTVTIGETEIKYFFFRLRNALKCSHLFM